MYLKRLSIEGFKSYRSLTEIEFSPYNNVMKGANGSGKSNLVAAVQFAFGYKLNALSTQERSELLSEAAPDEHAGAVARVVAELVLDAELQKELSVLKAKDTYLSLARTVDAESDVLLVNGETLPAHKVCFVLLSLKAAQFSAHSNVVGQGSVATWTTLTAPQRLRCVKSVLGLALLEKQEKEVKDFLTSVEQRSEPKLVEAKNFLAKKLRTLELEKRDLQQLKELETRKEAATFKLEGLETRRLEKQLERLDAQKERSHADSFCLQKELAEAERALRVAKRAEKRRRQKRARSAQRSVDGGAVVDSLFVPAESEKTLAAEAVRLGEQKDAARQRVAELQTRFAEKKSALVAVGSATEQRQLFADLSNSLDVSATTTVRTNLLHSLQNRTAAELVSAERRLAGLHKQKRELEKETASQTTAVRAAEADVAIFLANNEEERKLQRRALWRTKNEKTEELAELQSELRRNRKRLARTLSFSQAMTLRFLEHLANTNSPHTKGVHGVALSLLECEERLLDVVDATLLSTAFCVVVDTFSVVTFCLRALKEFKDALPEHSRGFAVAFLPLEAIAPRSVERPLPLSETVLGFLKDLVVVKLPSARARAALASFLFGSAFVLAELPAASLTDSNKEVLFVDLAGNSCQNGRFVGGVATVNKVAAFRKTRLLESVLARKKEEVAGVCEQLEIEKFAQKAVPSSKLQTLLRAQQLDEAKETLVALQAHVLRLDAETRVGEIRSAVLAEKAAAVRKVVDRTKRLSATDTKTLLNKELASLVCVQTLSGETVSDELLVANETFVETAQRLREVEAKLTASRVVFKQKYKQEATKERVETEPRLKEQTEVFFRLQRELRAEQNRGAGFVKTAAVLRNKALVLADRRTRFAAKHGLDLTGAEQHFLVDFSELSTVVADEETNLRALVSELSRRAADLLTNTNKKALFYYERCAAKLGEVEAHLAELEGLRTALFSFFRGFEQQHRATLQTFVTAVAQEFVSLSSFFDKDFAAELQTTSAGLELCVTTRRGERLRTTDLSEGQKAVLGLSFLLALKRVHNIPLLVLDEVDAALDEKHRKALAKLFVRKNGAGLVQGQLLISSFRKEMLSLGGDGQTITVRCVAGASSCTVEPL